MNTASRNPELAPCGIFCGACPSFGHTCLGCPSEDRHQKRTSKWACRIRKCCYEAHNLSFCIHCADFPCKTIATKLLDTHQGDPRYDYHHEVIKVFPRLLELGETAYYQYQTERWACKACGGRVLFYEYTCANCGRYALITG
jgi:hypothetical protein